MGDKINFSDIFKKHKEEDSFSGVGISFSRIKQEKPEEAKKEPPREDKISFSSTAGQQSKNENTPFDSALYSDAVALSRKIYGAELEESVIMPSINSLIERIVESIDSQNSKEMLLKAVLAGYTQPEDFLYYHVVNVCIISILLAKVLNYNSSELVELGAAAIFHDIGLSRYRDIISQPRRLNLHEYNKVKEHVVTGMEILEKIRPQPGGHVFEVINQEHERFDGSGYPRGIENGNISEYAQIVGLSDVYEAMIHVRPYRDKYSPLEAIKMILGSKKTFDNKLVKVLIEEIGIFPMGTFVRLNTKEIGEVIKGNAALPLRPLVKIQLDSSGRRLNSTRQINLADSPTVYIMEVVSSPTDKDA
ncbi:MAG: HD domain-containing protein [Candidatus Omnitrophica bacterium]|nr:HD domain-containing protein [Candidatus Omnitrophota bacterium]